MARYVLVEVDSNDTAERLRAQIDNAGEAKGMRVVGMFAKAASLCACPREGFNPHDTKRKSLRGAKFGWWVCPTCRKPKKGAGQTLKNLLDAVGTPAKYLNLFLCVKWGLDGDRVITERSRPTQDWR